MSYIKFIMGNLGFPLIFIILFCLASCNNNKNKHNGVTLYDGTVFLLENNELEKKTNFLVVDQFTKHIRSLDIENLPLYKYISHPEYSIYLGIPERKSNYNNIESDSVILVEKIIKNSGKRYIAIAVINDTLLNNKLLMSSQKLSSRFKNE